MGFFNKLGTGVKKTASQLSTGIQKTFQGTPKSPEQLEMERKFKERLDKARHEAYEREALRQLKKRGKQQPKQNPYDFIMGL